MTTSESIAAPPADIRDLIAAAEPRGRVLYTFVRQLVDELEEAVPWELLHAPPAEGHELPARIGRLLDLVQGTPQRITNELDELTLSGEPFGREARAEAEFYFAALHQMTAPSRRLLSAAAEKAPPGGALTRVALDHLAELAADLKNEYASAMMGAAAALLSNGRWLGVEVETTLFPEKADERLLNRRLLSGLKEASRALATIKSEFPWRDMVVSWQARKPVDRYAFADLLAVRTPLLRLLTVANRRAFFSGDHRLLRKRETLLGDRLRELEELHLRSIDLVTKNSAGAGAELYDRLIGLLVEIAAVVDVEVLRELIGGDALRRSRSRRPTAQLSPGATEEDPLTPLLAEEDLTIFIHLLLGAVTKRQSITFESGEVPIVRSVPDDTEPGTQTARNPRSDSSVAISLREAGNTHERLSTALARLLKPGYEPWKAFQMVHKLQARLRVLPPSLSAEILPFLSDLRNEVLPLVEEAAAIGSVPVKAAETLRACEKRLAASDFFRPESGTEIGADIGRVIRLLESLVTTFKAGTGVPSAQR
ncbi:MAG: hypothetical protein ABI639_10380 [Thermoanaerobaculia bacterium]